MLEEPMYAVVGKESPLSQYASVSIADLAGSLVITQPEGHGTNKLAHSFFEAAGVKPGLFVHVLDPESIVIQVSHRNGVGFIPESTYRFNKLTAHVLMDMAVAIPIQGTDCRRRVFLSYRKDKRLSNPARLLLDFLREYGVVTQDKHCLPDEDDFMVTGAYQMKATYPNNME